MGVLRELLENSIVRWQWDVSYGPFIHDLVDIQGDFWQLFIPGMRDRHACGEDWRWRRFELLQQRLNLPYWIPDFFHHPMEILEKKVLGSSRQALELLELPIRLKNVVPGKDKFKESWSHDIIRLR